MNIPVSSNFISGSYTFLEILLAIVLTRLLISIAGTLNVKAIYDDRRKIWLTTSGIPAISDPGLTIPRIRFFLALISVIVTLLMTAGQFGIVGVTEKEYEEVTVKYLVNKAPRGYVLNVKDHISMERKEVSKELILLSQIGACQRSTIPYWEMYAYIYDGDDIEKVGNDPDISLNITCVTYETGFEKKVSHLYRRNINWSSTIQMMPGKCNFSVSESDIAWGRVTKASIDTNCSLASKEAWCYKESQLYCTALWEYSGHYFLVAFKTDSYNGHFRSTLLADGEEYGTEKLKAGVFLLALGFQHSSILLVYMLSSRVERNATVRKIIDPSREATKIYVPLLSATVVPSVLILLFITFTAVYFWRQVIFIPGRQGYNRFNSAADLLSCAAVEKFRDGGCRYLRSGEISVGLDECGEYASPVKSDVNVNISCVEGEPKRRSDPSLPNGSLCLQRQIPA